MNRCDMSARVDTVLMQWWKLHVEPAQGCNDHAHLCDLDV